jgi:chemotaxis protein MotB
MAENAPPIIIIKKKGGHAAHHGGAWKVAYADFVTAMMALFIVLWLMNSSEQTKKAIAGYFNDPGGKGTQTGSGLAGSGEGVSLGVDDMNKLKEKLDQAMKQMPNFQKIKDQVEMTVTGEGLRIELLETEHGMFFESGNSQPSGQGREMLAKLAEELGKLQNKVLLEGHTDARPFTKTAGYSNWELSSDRANAARRLMEQHGLGTDQITQVRGYAAQKLRDISDPGAASNRRISLIVQYHNSPHTEVEGKPESPTKSEGHGASAAPAPTPPAHGK